jgi:hypothetical protein
MVPEKLAATCAKQGRKDSRVWGGASMGRELRGSFDGVWSRGSREVPSGVPWKRIPVRKCLAPCLGRFGEPGKGRLIPISTKNTCRAESLLRRISPTSELPTREFLREHAPPDELQAVGLPSAQKPENIYRKPIRSGYQHERVSARGQRRHRGQKG